MPPLRSLVRLLSECSDVRSFSDARMVTEGAARQVAEEARATFVPCQTMFNLAVIIESPAHWAAEGLHPTSYGAALMARWWLRAVGN